MTAFDAGRRAGQARYLDLHFFGGAANDVPRTATAYVHRDSLFSVNYRVLINDPAQVTDEAEAVANAWSTTASPRSTRCRTARATRTGWTRP